MPRQGKTIAAKKRISQNQQILLCIGLSLWVLAGFIIAAVFVGIINELLSVTGLLPEGAISATFRNAVIVALAYSATFAIVVGVPLKALNIPTTKEELGLTRLPSWMDILLAAGSFIAYIYLAGVLSLIVTILFPRFDADEAQDVGFSNISQYYEYILAFITLVIMAPLAEEGLMRGYLYGKLRKVTSVGVAVVVTSLLFSLMHFQWNVAVYVLPLGVLLAVLREKTGSIWAGVLLHMLKNGVAFYYLFVDPIIKNTTGG